MMKVYVCSPYRAKDGAELDRNIEYAQALTRRALKAGLAPITPHLYITQCLDEKKPQERAQGLAAGMELLKGCDFMIVGDKYGISEGMYREIETAKALRIPVINDAGLLVRQNMRSRGQRGWQKNTPRGMRAAFAEGETYILAMGTAAKSRIREPTIMQ